MTHTAHPTRQVLDIRRRYTPGRLAAACLAEAYETILPVVSRPIGSRQVVGLRGVEEDRPPHGWQEAR